MSASDKQIMSSHPKITDITSNSPTVSTDSSFDGPNIIQTPQPTCRVAIKVEMTECQITKLHNENIQNNTSQKIDQNPAVKSQPTTNDKTDHGHKVHILRDFLFWIRIFILILSIFLLLLSTSYCIAQLLEVKLDIITECENPKTLEEIWAHSYQASLGNGAVEINAQSQHGHSTESCWTTKKIDINTDQLWYSNKYIHNWKQTVNAQCVLFGLLSIYLLVIIFYNTITLIIDIVYITKGRLHTKSVLYGKYMRSLKKSAPKISNKPSSKKEAKFARNWSKFTKCYWTTYYKYFVNDTFGWIILKFTSEFTEFILQSQALLLYNGYYLFDRNNENGVYLAEKPQFIIIFAAILFFNCFGSGFLWLLYAVLPKHCHGLLYKRSIFFIDKFSDLLYTFFPFYIAVMDDYNTNVDNVLVLLGQLNMDSTWVFLATFIPLLFLCNKSLIMIITTMGRMRNQYFRKWKAQTALSKHSSVNTAMQTAKSAGYNIDMNALPDINEIYDANGMLMVNVNAISKTYQRNWIDRNDSYSIKKAKYIRPLKQTLLVLISLCLIGYSIFLLIFTIDHIHSSETVCGSVGESKYFSTNGTLTNNLSNSEKETLLNNPELFFWDNCLYKVYPFSNGHNKCQCRVFVIDWNSLVSTEDLRKTHFNLSQRVILNGILNNWYMLEKFKTQGNGGTISPFTIKNTSYKSAHMIAFEWSDISIESIQFGISNWKKMEYFAFMDATGLRQLPQDFNELSQMKYLLFMANSLSSFSESICQLKQLIVLQMEYELEIKSIPHCIFNLKQLKAFWVDFSPMLTSIPLSIFNLPHLIELSLYNGNIDYRSLLQYNIPNIQSNDTLSINAWFDGNLQPQNKSYNDYWFSFNPICEENITSFPASLKHILSSSNCHHPCDVDSLYDKFCIPRKVGDGRCDDQCQLMNCFHDYGDCVQLCFAHEITNCSFDKLTNNKCDKGCDNKYCSQYMVGSDFKNPERKKTEDNKYSKALTLQSDMFTCLTNNSANSLWYSSDVFCAESATKSPFIDPNVPNYSYYKCPDHWIGDGKCDDSCMTEQCSYDNGDCDQENACSENQENENLCYTMYQFWNAIVTQHTSSHKVSHSYGCSNLWPIALAIYPEADNLTCSQVLTSTDYNKDQFLNFREFIVVAAIFSGADTEQWTQVNCSQCYADIGIEHYNI
eukprot:24602_1